jgi:thioredoxin-dependent peroxiredoxin
MAKSKLKFALSALMFPFLAHGQELKIGDNAPLFETKTHDGKNFSLSSRKGQWTVLYFYPRAETPGCTKQACAFRDSIKTIRDQNAEVFGISSDSVENQRAFHKNHSLNFTLLADPEGKIIEQYGTKMPAVTLSKRWTFIIDGDLKIRSIDKQVDPAKDPDQVASIIRGFALKPGKSAPQSQKITK